MVAFSLPDGQTRDALVSQVMEEGAIVLPCGDQSIRFRPPLNISGQEIDRGLEMLGRAMAKLFD
jgi:L-lysine 6-transaminase